MKVKVIQLPGTVKEVTVNPGATIADALQQANIGLEQGFSIKRNGLDAQTNTAVAEGDNIIVSRGAKGNAKTVEHQTLVNGRNIANMTRHELFAAAVSVKAKIKELKEANEGINSTAIAKEVEALEADLKEVVALVDKSKAE